MLNYLVRNIIYKAIYEVKKIILKLRFISFLRNFSIKSASCNKETRWQEEEHCKCAWECRLFVENTRNEYVVNQEIKHRDNVMQL